MMTHQDYISSGWWLILRGQVVRAVPSHIAVVCEHPEVFGVDPDELRELFKRCKEPMGSEGIARQIVILKIVNGGAWMRLRHYPQSGWTVNLRAVGPMPIGALTSFFQWLLGSGPEFYHDPVYLNHQKGRTERNVIEFQRGLTVHGTPLKRRLPKITLVEDVVNMRTWALPRIRLRNINLPTELREEGSDGPC